MTVTSPFQLPFMYPPEDHISPLPSFAMRRKSRLQGPRPTSWMYDRSQSSDDIAIGWSVVGPRTHLSRESTISSQRSTGTSYSCASSDTSSSSLDYSPYTISDFELHEAVRLHRSQRRKPRGPRAMDSSCSSSAVQRPPRPTLSINTSSPPEPPAISLPLAEFPPIAPDCRSPSFNYLPPPIHFSPSEDLIDWDAIYEALGC
ncbi:hypothetical protein BJ138DRAFT_4065 [Hygrophoropsis aurantiaca]|uniref:Uncharacterized protein n=1 Tax=Hygrophoropsis aurantiaca TaxID=72124 RepID=A0ACB8ASY4_9AGAM|nr:hypothetical protein BJ138DRAFT_4065 [Hygrophoropsis aurantiaca]